MYRQNRSWDFPPKNQLHILNRRRENHVFPWQIDEQTDKVTYRKGKRVYYGISNDT